LPTLFRRSALRKNSCASNYPPKGGFYIEVKMSERVLIQGRSYSFHDQAAALLGIPKGQRESVKTHNMLYDTLHDRENGRAVAAFFNTTKGRIGGSYERIMAGDAQIVGRADLGIVLPLYGMPHAQFEDIRFIHTQSHAMDQAIRTVSRDFAHTRWVSEEDTATSAFTVRELRSSKHAAITPHPAGKAAGLVCLVDAMQDNRTKNVTSFYELGKGENGVVPVDATVTVAALHRIGGEQQSSGQLQIQAEIGAISLLHVSEAKSWSLIVEMNSEGEHAQAIEGAEIALRGLYNVTYLGGYAPLSLAA
jgi:prephenate dehydratase